MANLRFKRIQLESQVGNSVGQNDPEQEEWRDIPQFPGYQISDHGRVRSFRVGGRPGNPFSKKPKILSPAPHGRYLTVGLRSPSGETNNQYIHRLVLESFVGPCPDKMECAHNNGDGNDNRLTNLRWSSFSDNNMDKVRHNTDNRGEKHWRSQFTPQDIITIRQRFHQGESANSIANDFQSSQSCISVIVSGRSWGHVDFFPDNSKRKMPTKNQNGENNKMSKLTEDDVVQIRKLYQNGEKQKDIALKFDISSSCVCNIVNKKVWKHVN